MPRDDLRESWERTRAHLARAWVLLPQGDDDSSGHMTPEGECERSPNGNENGSAARKLLAAGVEAELHVFEATPHGGFDGDTPEDADRMQSVLRFLDHHRRSR